MVLVCRCSQLLDERCTTTCSATHWSEPQVSIWLRYLLSAVIVVLLSIWTGLDLPPTKETEYHLTERVTDNGENVVSINYYCDSKSDHWTYCMLPSDGILFTWSLQQCLRFKREQSRNISMSRERYQSWSTRTSFSSSCGLPYCLFGKKSDRIGACHDARRLDLQLRRHCNK